MRYEGIDRTSGDLRAGQTAALGLCVEPVELGYQLQPGVAESLEAGLELGVERASV